MTKKLIDYKLYLITDRKLFKTTDELLLAVETALSAGVRAVQLREKELHTRELLALSYELRKITAEYSAGLFINDRFDVALCVEADGVHLGQSGIPVNAARRAVGSGLIIGCSTHSLREAMDAEKEGADFITFGPLFPTPSKLKYGEPVGLEALREVRENVGLPIFGIGGIKVDNVEAVINSGASGVALISGILSAPDKAAATREYIKKVGD